ncbi:unnamed protein product [Effrenium voratum]|nr:unnamed protein product [Effrenium voratum]
MENQIEILQSINPSLSLSCVDPPDTLDSLFSALLNNQQDIASAVGADVPLTELDARNHSVASQLIVNQNIIITKMGGSCPEQSPSPDVHRALVQVMKNQVAMIQLTPNGEQILASVPPAEVEFSAV